MIVAFTNFDKWEKNREQERGFLILRSSGFLVRKRVPLMSPIKEKTAEKETGWDFVYLIEIV